MLGCSSVSIKLIRDNCYNVRSRREPARKQRRLTDLWRGTVSVETDVESPGATTSQSVSTTCSQAVLKLQVFVLLQ